MGKGKLIVLEGIDGAGKETQTKRLFQVLHGSSFPVRQIIYPKCGGDGEFRRPDAAGQTETASCPGCKDTGLKQN